MSSSPHEYFAADHRHCDEIWSEVESAVDAGDAARARERFDTFSTALLRHLDMEENVLFPAFEEATGMHGGGPTFVMRREHEQMRGVLDQMAGAAERDDLEGLVDHGDTLLMLIQQHNTKEEGMLYPMADQALGARWAELLAQLEKY